MSKFRLDSQPIEGPGSRGGKGGRKSPRGRVTASSIRKRSHQSTLNFKPVNGENTVSLNLSKNEKDTEPVSDSTNNVTKPATSQPPKLVLKIKQPSTTSVPSKTLTPIASAKSHSTTPISISQKKSKPGKRTTRTTVLNGKNKVTRQFPGPLVGLYYDLYDDGLVDPYFDAKHEKVCFGYPVSKAPFASDIVFIISFLLKFKDVVGIENIGPNTIEYGLSLPIADETYDTDSEAPVTLRKSVKESEDYDPGFVSPEMHNLFLKLLGLVLNRKKPVTSHTKAIQELKPQSIKLGLPKEWKISQPPTDDNSSLQEAQEPVDLTRPEILIDSIPQNNSWMVTFNPFQSPEFEKEGLAGLENPMDRLILLRTLIQWTFAKSDLVKGKITASMQQQDIPGDKETYYAARSILYGFKNAQDTKVAVEAKIAKRKADDDTKYIDPTSDPLDHCFNLRLNEQIAGDIGFKIGRFYLCRMADEHNGGLSSIKKMQSVWKGPAGLNGPLASNFKLYVQDVHQMLVESLSVAGVEFNDQGEEVEPTHKATDEQEHWYEVASNSRQLKDFVQYLGSRLESIEGSSMKIPQSLQLYEYLLNVLPLIEKSEEARDTRRSTRKRPIDYSDTRAAARYSEVLDVEEYIDDNENGDDNYIQFEAEDDEDEYME
ncbi:hypothetical protein SBY92_000081 [Candida maltosa Xu316]